MSIIYEALEKRDKKNKLGWKYLKINRRSIGIFSIVIIGIIAFSFLKGRTPKQKVCNKAGIVSPEQQAPVNPKPRLISKRHSGKYDLQGIIYDEQSPIAVINGKKLNVGESIEEARLTEVSLSGVRIEVDGGTLFIPLEE